MTVDETISKYNLIDHKFYRLNTLYLIFQELGVVNMKRESFTSDWIRHKMQKGALVLPPKPKGDLRKLSGKMIKDIVKAFVPGGTGSYNYETDTTVS